MLKVRLGGFNNLELVIPPPATPSNRHERRELKKTGTIRRDK